MKIYMLEDGQYSDYHVIGLYTTEENAQLAQKIYGGEYTEIEVDAINLNFKNFFDQGLFPYSVEMLHSGDTTSVYKNANPTDSKVQYTIDNISYWADRNKHKLICTKGLYVTAWASSISRARG